MERNETLALLRKIVQRSKGDDLERAEMAFARLSPQQLDEPYGQSGQTCRQILEGYRQARAEWQAVCDLVHTLE